MVAGADQGDVFRRDMGYSMEEKVYTYYGVDNSPMAMLSVPKGTVKGKTWTYEDESMMGGQMVKSRFVIEIESPTRYKFSWAMQAEDGSWMTLAEGTAKKAG